MIMLVAFLVAGPAAPYLHGKATQTGVHDHDGRHGMLFNVRQASLAAWGVAIALGVVYAIRWIGDACGMRRHVHHLDGDVSIVLYEHA